MHGLPIGENWSSCDAQVFKERTAPVTVIAPTLGIEGDLWISAGTSFTTPPIPARPSLHATPWRASSTSASVYPHPAYLPSRSIAPYSTPKGFSVPMTRKLCGSGLTAVNLNSSERLPPSGPTDLWSRLGCYKRRRPPLLTQQSIEMHISPLVPASLKVGLSPTTHGGR